MYFLSCVEIKTIIIIIIIIIIIPWLNHALSDIVLKDHLVILHKLADEVVTDDVTCGKRDVDPHGRLRAAQWRMG